MALTDDIFYSKYTPEYNQVLLPEKPVNVAPEDMCGFGGCMYETHGMEYEYVKLILKESPKRLWSILDVDGELVIAAGYHFVDIFGYLVTNEEWEDENEEYIDECYDDENLED